MGYKMTRHDRWAKTRSQDLTGGVVTKTATYQTTGLELGDQSTLRLDCIVTAHAGTSPTLDVKIQTSPDNSTWTDIPSAAFSQYANANGSKHLVCNGLDRFVRAYVTIGGSAGQSFTFSVTGESA